MRGQLHFLNNDLTNAILDFDKAIELNPATSAPRCYRGRRHYLSAAYQKVIVNRKKNIDLSSQHHDNNYLLGSGKLKSEIFI